MSVLGEFEKQPVEERFFDVNVAQDLMSGDTVDAASVAVTCLTDGADSALTASVVSTSTTQVRVFVEGGTDGRKYKVTTTTSTAMGEVFQDEVLIKVRDR